MNAASAVLSLHAQGRDDARPRDIQRLQEELQNLDEELKSLEGGDRERVAMLGRVTALGEGKDAGTGIGAVLGGVLGGILGGREGAIAGSCWAEPARLSARVARTTRCRPVRSCASGSRSRWSCPQR